MWQNSTSTKKCRTIEIVAELNASHLLASDFREANIARVRLAMLFCEEPYGTLHFGYGAMFHCDGNPMSESNILIKKILPECIGEAKQFLLPNEAECVNLCEMIFCKNAQDCYAVIYEEKIVGVFCFRNRRTIFHCLPFTKYKTALDKILCQETQAAFYEFFADEKPFCINGEATGSLFLKNIFRNKKNPVHAKVTNEYFLMQKTFSREESAEANSSLSACENQSHILPASPCDEEKLFPLECAYQF